MHMSGHILDTNNFREECFSDMDNGEDRAYQRVSTALSSERRLSTNCLVQDNQHQDDNL